MPTWKCMFYKIFDGIPLPLWKTLMTWWRHQMETFSALLAFCVGNSPVTSEFLAQRPVMWRFYVFFDLCLNRQLSKQWRRWWLDTLLWSLWRHCNVVSLQRYSPIWIFRSVTPVESAYYIPIVISEEITHWGLNNMADILQTFYAYAFCWMISFYCI